MTASSVSGHRIVVAEDDPMILELVRTRLELAGYRVSWARNGRQAIDAILSSRPTAVVLDLNMPGIDGFDVLRSLKESGKVQHIPVLVLTARHSPADIATCIELGAADYLMKPFDEPTLFRRIARLVKGSRRQTTMSATYLD